MTVGELRQILEQYHDATPVFVDGYEGGYDPPGYRLMRIAKTSNTSWWNGDWEENEHSGIEALVLQRPSK